VAPLTAHQIQQLIRDALAEDIGPGDATTIATVPPHLQARARLIAREPLTVAGLELAFAAFRELSARVEITGAVPDGTQAAAGDGLATIEGPAAALLTAERVALNCVQRLSGIATLTAAFVEAVAGTDARILDTRKTTPGWRRLEKYAVTCGGGLNHRPGLSELVLIKDNHLVALRDAKPNPITAAVRLARLRFPHLKVEVEADTLDQVEQALAAGADIVLLDNMSLEQLREAVTRCRDRALTEASGGVRLETARAVARSGVDFLSVGALTHSARWVDIGLDFME
jgi:nicotinate-nucleotide pyrophosphorylase (carboxylating)